MRGNANESSPTVRGLEPFVDSAAVAAHTGMAKRTVSKWAREGLIPAHPAPGGTKRHTWMFKLSEVDFALASQRSSATIPVRPGGSAEGR
jgi:hypothetical protein